MKSFASFLGTIVGIFLVIILIVFAVRLVVHAQVDEIQPIEQTIKPIISKVLPLSEKLAHSSFVVKSSLGSFYTSVVTPSDVFSGCVDVDSGDVICGTYIISVVDSALESQFQPLLDQQVLLKSK